MSKGKRQNLNHARTMDIDAWRVRQVSERTRRLMDEQDRAFREAHAADTEAELREYIRQQARVRRRMPHPLELQGGRYLRERLGDWDALALSLGFAPADQSRGRKAYLRLRERGEALFLRERKERKNEKALRKAQRGQTKEAPRSAEKEPACASVSPGEDFPPWK